MIDTHSHIYLEEFDEDRKEVIQRAKDIGVQYIVLPNIDSSTLPRVHQVEKEESDYCFAAIGLHPTSVKENFKEELEVIKLELQQRKYIAIGEIGIDLYWDKKFYKEQEEAFCQQVEWAIEYELPILIHIRNSFEETINALSSYKNTKLSGVFHSFAGTIEEAEKILNFGKFKIGINGILTFKNSKLSKIIENIGLNHIVLETDAPYLAPVPFRGKRNESAYIYYICQHLANVLKKPMDEVDQQTTRNANEIFKLFCRDS